MRTLISLREVLAFGTWGIFIASVATLVAGWVARFGGAHLPEGYELARTASVAVVVVAAAYVVSGVVLATAAWTALANGWVRLGRWCVACMRRHPSLGVRAGRYREALNFVDAWPSRAARIGRVLDPVAALLARVNRAEALHNLGRDDEALAELDHVLPSTRDGGLVESGALTLEA